MSKKSRLGGRLAYKRIQEARFRSENPKDALNVPLKNLRGKRTKQNRERGLPGVTQAGMSPTEVRQDAPRPAAGTILAHTEGADEERKEDPRALLVGLYYSARSTEDLERLCERARNVGFGELETRCLDDLAVRRARGTWIATHRRPLPGGAFSNLRQS